MEPMAMLAEMRAVAGERATVGLSDDVVAQFLENPGPPGRALREAIGRGWEAQRELCRTRRELLALPEVELVRELQSDLVNFYSPETVNPYVAIAAAGPWVITSHGAVIHDNGGYGMLGSGHAPGPVLEAMARPWVMANVMTPSFSQRALAERLRKEIGQTRDGCPFSRFIFMNSGSEAVTVALRITDVNCARQTGPGGPHAGKPARFVALKGAFHGRTDRPAQVSASTLPRYREHLNSFRGRDNLLLVAPNDLAELRRVFEEADASGSFVEAMLLEPIQGEGNPGVAVTREFYDLARRLTAERGSLLVADSIQAGLRGTGYLSIVDYPGFEGCDPPDLETYSKALNAGQYPMSVLACTPKAAGLYVNGIYGNTMTTNPRALEVASVVLDGITPALRQNIRARGAELLEKLRGLVAEFPGIAVRAQGTGLLCALEIDGAKAQVVGMDGLETWCRRHGLGVIHGGKNALRFTPHFAITSEEIDLVVAVVRQSLVAKTGLEGLTVPAQELEYAELVEN